MLILLRYASLILALVLMLSLLLAIVIMVRNAIEKRLPGKKKKGKEGNLPSDAGVRELILENKIEEAIDLYQRFTGMDEFTARKAIEDMEREIRLSTFDADLKTILKEHGKAAAIQAYQAGTGSELEEALNYVEEIVRAK